MSRANGHPTTLGYITWARDQAAELELSATSAHVLLVLATYADSAGTAFPSVARLCSRCRRQSRSTVLDALRDLTERGLIDTTRGRRKTIRRLLMSGQPDVRPTGPDTVRPTGRAEVRPTGPPPSGPPDTEVATENSHGEVCPPIPPGEVTLNGYDTFADWANDHFPDANLLDVVSGFQVLIDKGIEPSPSAMQQVLKPGLWEETQTA